MPHTPPLIAAPLTGARTYQFGADIFDAVIGQSGARRDMVLQLKVPAACAIALMPGEAPPDADLLCGTFRHAGRSGVERAWLRLVPDRPITIRRPADDAAITAGARFGAAAAELPAGGAGTFAQRAVLLALGVVTRAQPGHRWRIAEIGCARIPGEAATLAVALRHRVGGRFWKFDLAADGDPVGSVILARVPAPE